MPSAPLVLDRSELAPGLCRWFQDALGGDGAIVLLAVGDSTLPLYAGLPEQDARWGSKRILPLDELVDPPAGRSFGERLRGALPAALRARVSDLDPRGDPAGLEDEIARDGVCAAVLGLGPDGHIAFNQPGSDATTSARIVELTQDNSARIGGIASRALTVGVGTILRARRIALIVSGMGKAGALARVLDGPEGDDVPASFLRRHPALTVFVDGSTCA